MSPCEPKDDKAVTLGDGPLPPEPPAAGELMVAAARWEPPPETAAGAASEPNRAVPEGEPTEAVVAADTEEEAGARLPAGATSMAPSVCLGRAR